MKAKPMKVLRELAQMGNAGEEMMRSAYPKMRGEDFDPSMLEGIIDITELPQMYKELDEEVESKITIRTIQGGPSVSRILLTITKVMSSDTLKGSYT